MKIFLPRRAIYCAFVRVFLLLRELSMSHKKPTLEEVSRLISEFYIYSWNAGHSAGADKIEGIDAIDCEVELKKAELLEAIKVYGGQ